MLWPEDAAALYDIQETQILAVSPGPQQLCVADPQRIALIIGLTTNGQISTKSTVLASSNNGIPIGGTGGANQWLFNWDQQGPLVQQQWWGSPSATSGNWTVITVSLRRKPKV